MRMPAIGILAGMGPRSTAPFVDMVVDECLRQYGAHDDMDFPEMVVISLPTPFYAGKPVDHGAMRAAITEGLKDLERTGVSFIAMPCNTAHIYYDALCAAVRIPIMNIVEETVRALPEGTERAALFATAATVEAGIYRQGLERAGIVCVVRPEWQPKVDALLSALKAGGDEVETAAMMAELLADAGRLGAGCAMIGCTDLTPAALRCHAGLPVVDSARCLARAAVAKWLELRG